MRHLILATNRCMEEVMLLITCLMSYDKKWCLLCQMTCMYLSYVSDLNLYNLRGVYKFWLLLCLWWRYQRRRHPREWKSFCYNASFGFVIWIMESWSGISYLCIGSSTCFIISNYVVYISLWEFLNMKLLFKILNIKRENKRESWESSIKYVWKPIYGHQLLWCTT